MAALVQLGEDWYGLVHSWADSKKKSNLMLSCLPPGDDAVPWLGPLGQLGPADPADQGTSLLATRCCWTISFILLKRWTNMN